MFSDVSQENLAYNDIWSSRSRITQVK